MRVCVNADKVLFMDGHASNRSVSTLQAIYDMKKAQEPDVKPLAFIRNTYVVHKREALMLHSSTAGGKSTACKE
jgi:hypothetical protein